MIVSIKRFTNLKQNLNIEKNCGMQCYLEISWKIQLFNYLEALLVEVVVLCVCNRSRTDGQRNDPREHQDGRSDL